MSHRYVSTACQHERHKDCRRECKFCDAPCLCPCHRNARERNDAAHAIRRAAIGVGMPEWIKLNWFGRVVNEFFGHYPYLVGSAAKGKDWRDVDVRLILPDAEFDDLLGPLGRPRSINLKWNAACVAFSALGRDMTALPIDFQIDRQTECNQVYGGGARHGLIFADHIAEAGADPEHLTEADLWRFLDFYDAVDAASNGYMGDSPLENTLSPDKLPAYAVSNAILMALAAETGKDFNELVLEVNDRRREREQAKQRKDAAVSDESNEKTTEKEETSTTHTEETTTEPAEGDGGGESGGDEGGSDGDGD